MAAPELDWEMGSRASQLIDWRAASQVGKRVGGAGLLVPPLERARLREDFAELVPEAETFVTEFTGLTVGGYRSRAWVMSRSEWVNQNLRGLRRLIEPLAARILSERRNGDIRRKALGAQVGVLLGYVSRKVLGQYDIFLPPDDDGVLYFVGANVAEVERRFALPHRDFRLWLALHEVAHRVQFGGAPWLRQYLSGMVDRYLATVELDAKELMERLKRAAAEAQSTRDWRGLGFITLLMTPAQRELFERMQAVMSLLEGHATFVMNGVAEGRVQDLAHLRRSLRDRRRSSGVERSFQRVIGFDSKVRQYDAGEHFVSQAVRSAGMERFNLVWKDEANLPTHDEVANPDRWLARVANA